jgi:hypothetical protein
VRQTILNDATRQMMLLGACFRACAYRLCVIMCHHVSSVPPCATSLGTYIITHVHAYVACACVQVISSEAVASLIPHLKGLINELSTGDVWEGCGDGLLSDLAPAPAQGGATATGHQGGGGADVQRTTAGTSIGMAYHMMRRPAHIM